MAYILMQVSSCVFLVPDVAGLQLIIGVGEHQNGNRSEHGSCYNAARPEMAVSLDCIAFHCQFITV